jgi:hypothetical protein
MSLRSYACGCNFESKERFLLRAIGRTPVMANTVSAAGMPCAVELLCVLAQHLLDRFDLGETEALKRAGTRGAFGGTRPLRREGGQTRLHSGRSTKSLERKGEQEKALVPQRPENGAPDPRGASAWSSGDTASPVAATSASARPSESSPAMSAANSRGSTASSRNQRGRFNSVNGRT